MNTIPGWSHKTMVEEKSRMIINGLKGFSPSTEERKGRGRERERKRKEREEEKEMRKERFIFVMGEESFVCDSLKICDVDSYFNSLPTSLNTFLLFISLSLSLWKVPR